MVASLPKILWIELTSKCPFDCVFCSRRLRRGDGQHMDFHLYRNLIRQLREPEIIRLNYSGESIHYPFLAEAVALAKGAGATVELVTALASAPPATLERLAAAGLDRLTISLHALDPARFEAIYRFSSVEQLLDRIRMLHDFASPKLDFAFVAMQQNLEELPKVVAFARQAGVLEVFVHPVLRRDPIPFVFAEELTSGFRARLRRVVEQTREAVPEVRVIVSNPAVENEACLSLPPGSRIRTCDQNPWETAHVLANGDVVACEVHDHVPLGNLRAQTLDQIWRGEPYRRFREEYARARNPECRRCPFKTVYVPGPAQPFIDAAGGMSAQLLRGWHPQQGESVVWSRRESELRLTRAGGRRVRLQGVLPHGPGPEPNALHVSCDGEDLGQVRNAGPTPAEFDVSFPLPAAAPEEIRLGFTTRFTLRPSREGMNKDSRDLGFALCRVEVLDQEPRDGYAAPCQCEAAFQSRGALWAHQGVVPASRLDQEPQLGRATRRLLLAPLICAAALVDRVYRTVRSRARQIPSRPSLDPHWRPGLSVVIPERENADLLEECLASLWRAARELAEPWEAIVVVNGSPRHRYARLESQYRTARWIYAPRPLGFSRAIQKGLRAARYDWVYLMNNDMTVDQSALEEVLCCRAADVFAVASQIYSRDPRQERKETNWTGLELHDGLIELRELDPGDAPAVRESLYAGGGSSLFRTALLRKWIGASAGYDPFYWEDVEWGTRAWKLGYRVLFCPRSIARHRYRATVRQFYSPEEIERIFRRNGYLYQLRNITELAPLGPLLERLAGESWRSVVELLFPARALGALAARAGSHFYPYGDDLLVRRQAVVDEASRAPGERADPCAPAPAGQSPDGRPNAGAAGHNGRRVAGGPVMAPRHLGLGTGLDPRSTPVSAGCGGVRGGCGCGPMIATARFMSAASSLSDQDATEAPKFEPGRIKRL
ncbi:MAG: glycosyltransferase [Acidobacteria bacterium]|nr:glycosyltransferase [Acidobacteriota bacterium]